MTETQTFASRHLVLVRAVHDLADVEIQGLNNGTHSRRPQDIITSIYLIVSGTS